MIRPAEEMKARCAQAAAMVLAEPRPHRLMELLSAQEIKCAPAEPRAAHTGDAEVRVGIWKQHLEANGEKVFVRDHSKSLRLWADVERIPPKGRRRRVILLGESVARGYFYDPHFNFASALRSVFDFAEVQDVEVVDLAQTDNIAPQLIRLRHEALALDPDAFIVFAGNNWMLHHDTPNFSLPDAAAILYGGGSLAELRAHCEEVLRNLARTFMKNAAEILHERGIPTVFVLPEFNLLDWRNERIEQMPFRSHDESAAWDVAYIGATKALADGELECAEEFAKQLLTLDSGSAPAGFEVLARCALARNKLTDARRWLEAARDSGLFVPVPRSPRCYSVIQEVLRHEAEPNGIILVDMPRRFQEYLNGELPGRRLFLDYCHMTAEGIRVTAASTAERLLQALGVKSPSWSFLLHANLDIQPRVAADALFQAAIHNAHCGQGRDIVEFQCREALRQEPGIADIMVRFVDSTLRRAPSVICGSMAAIASEVGDQSAAALQIFHALPPLKKNLNLLLSEVLISLLSPRAPGLRAVADRLLTSEFSLDATPTDLLERAYSSSSMQDWDWINKTMYYRAHYRESPFRLICSRVSPVRLVLTARIQGINQASSISVIVNEIEILCLAASSNWQSWEFDIPDSLLVPGLNTIVLRWPCSPYSRADRMEQIAEQAELGGVPDINVIYGEICRFTAVAQVPAEQAHSFEQQPVFWPEVEASLIAGTDQRPDAHPIAVPAIVAVTR